MGKFAALAALVGVLVGCTAERVILCRSSCVECKQTDMECRMETRVEEKADGAIIKR